MSKDRMAGVKDAVRRSGGLTAMGLTQQHLLVLLALADHENDETGKCNPSSQTIAKENDQNASRVRVLWGQLESWGFIKELKRVPVSTVGKSIYWGFNEGRLPKAITEGNTQEKLSPKTITQGNTQKGNNHPPQHEPLKESKLNQSISLPSLPAQDGLAVGEDGTLPEEGEDVLPANGNQIPDDVEEGPKLPVILCLLQLLRGRKITRPRRLESWPTLEARLQRKLNPAELVELEEYALPWVFDPDLPGYWSTSSKHWRDAILDPKKDDLIGFFAKWAWKILEDFQSNRAHDTVENQQPPPKAKGKRKATRPDDDDDEEETDLWR